MIAFVPLGTIDAAEVEALLDRAFGPDRHARTAYTVRGASAPIAALSFAAVDDGALVGTIQCWPVQLSADDGTVHPMVMIGPVAVAPERQRDGIGRMLMTHALRAANETGRDTALMLIGDPEYYGRFFGFDATRTGAWRLPGPVERHRLLSKGDGVPTLAGQLEAAATRVIA
ncbi:MULTISPECIES: GNAT family N-acetyltransferase [unclassified Sphingomonas]|uniref:GNAT family N-acetyltransferase n=1 Tax=unclassified Sphingomonas TaxID=196159 RepID=UPI000E10485D|nr:MULTISPECIES: N-acetyltransferase [unclassified Sphingomonas]AXJ96295.1 GNAT family N-acetyltransferase [Sphingomonas sp. FARSPH]